MAKKKSNRLSHPGKCKTRVGVVAGAVIVECKKGCGAGQVVASTQPVDFSISPAA